ncbi:MAG: MFS transporter, partial [Alistipes sp.]|nr:MFS transporter [Alistipes sp.]
MKAEQKNYTLPIIMMFALFFMIAFVTGLQNPLGVIVKEQFKLADWQTQLGNAANFIAYAFMGYPAGLLLQRIGYKKTALWAIAIGFIGVAVILLGGVAVNFYVYLTGAFIGGFSMCMLNTVVNPMLNTIGGGGNRGNQLVQFGGSCNSLGATIVPVLGGYLMSSTAGAIGATKTILDTAPALYLALGIFAVAFFVLWLTNIPEPYVAKVEQDKNDPHSALSFRHF